MKATIYEWNELTSHFVIVAEEENFYELNLYSNKSDYVIKKVYACLNEILIYVERVQK